MHAPRNNITATVEGRSNIIEPSKKEKPIREKKKIREIPFGCRRRLKNQKEKKLKVRTFRSQKELGQS